MRVIKDRDTLDLIDKIIDSSESGLPIRKLYFTVARKLLFARSRPFYQRRNEGKILFKLYGWYAAFSQKQKRIEENKKWNRIEVKKRRPKFKRKLAAF